MTDLSNMLALDLIVASREVKHRITSLTEALKQARRDQQAIDAEMDNRANRPLPHTEPDPAVVQPQATRRRLK